MQARLEEVGEALGRRGKRSGRVFMEELAALCDCLDSRLAAAAASCLAALASPSSAPALVPAALPTLASLLSTGDQALALPALATLHRILHTEAAQVVAMAGLGEELLLPALSTLSTFPAPSPRLLLLGR